MSTGIVTFKNDWGEDISSITIRHRRSNDPNKQEQETLNNIRSGETAESVLKVTYETGSGSPYDYWWVKFITSSGRLYTMKDNFYCSIGSNDNGNVTLRIDGATQEMYVTFSASSGCEVSIYPSVLIFVDEQKEIHIPERMV
ncbi:hypothetical protein [Photorhabdus sp. SF281]|uniref:hypothetical protein n=1 Tax=Photorhabdus sp. SF281 TaxID=3459527 RepID=UPI004043ED3C